MNLKDRIDAGMYFAFIKSDMFLMNTIENLYRRLLC